MLVSKSCRVGAAFGAPDETGSLHYPATSYFNRGEEKMFFFHYLGFLVEYEENYKKSLSQCYSRRYSNTCHFYLATFLSFQTNLFHPDLPHQKRNVIDEFFSVKECDRGEINLKGPSNETLFYIFLTSSLQDSRSPYE